MLRNEIELNQIIAILSDDIIDRIYSDMQSLETLPDISDSLTMGLFVDVTV